VAEEIKRKLCDDCGREVLWDGGLVNDNFMHLCRPHDRMVYEGMKARNLHCRHDGCTCAYGHQRGICRKCGHYTHQEALNA
jgi:hypothetical protein